MKQRTLEQRIEKETQDAKMIFIFISLIPIFGIVGYVLAYTATV